MKSFFCYLCLLGAANLIASEKELSDKGISRDQVMRDVKPFSPPRARPDVRYFENGPSPENSGNEDFKSAKVKLLERADTMRPEAQVSFGFPFPQGALFDLKKIRLKHEGGKMFPADVAGLSLWPDGSIKSALISFSEKFSPSESKDIRVEFGNKVSPQTDPVASPLQVEEDEETIKISTGKLTVIVEKKIFVPFLKVLSANGSLIATSTGVELRDENGELFSTALSKPERVSLERKGAHESVIRVEGRFGNKEGGHFMKYVTRLRFFSGSSRVDMIHTQINDELAHEFSDFSSLSLTFEFPRDESWTSTIDLGQKFEATPEFTFFQKDENTSIIQRGASAPETLKARPSGAVTLKTQNGPVQAGVAQIWQRWPKGIRVAPGKLSISLLPELTSEFTDGLPWYLTYSFVDNRHRLKWGMAFTERLGFDFQAAENRSALAAELNTPILAILDSQYLASTKALGALGTPDWEGSRLWDAYMRDSLKLHHQQRDLQREYGALNFGDWYGERGRNWGNNEYDRAHGFFTHFARTGDAAFFDDALSAARHQADSDIVHAYPDPYYVGANPQHSIGHTGISYQRVKPIWSYQYDVATSAGNGHTWADGMADSWILTGDPVIMESLLALGEHIAWAFAPSYHKLTYTGAHERNAGWSMLAALAAYRATSDPDYLDAAKKIASVSLREWNPREGWAHELPAQHADFQNKIRGNSLFNVGILLHGLSRYHAETQDPMALECLDKASEWIVKAWNPETLSWPYSASVEGKALSPDTQNLNPLIYPGLTYAGLILENKRYLEVALQALLATFPPGAADSRAKEYSIKANATAETLALLAQASSRGLITRWPEIAELFANLPLAKEITFNANSGPSFRVSLTGENATLSIRSFEGIPIASANITLVANNGKILPSSRVEEQQCSWDFPDGKSGPFTLKIKHPSRWRIFGEGIAVDLLPGTPLRLQGFGTTVAELLTNRGGKGSVLLEGDGAGALMFLPDGKKIYAQPAPSQGGNPRLLSYESAAPSSSKVILWGNGPLTISLSRETSSVLRLLLHPNIPSKNHPTPQP